MGGWEMEFEWMGGRVSKWRPHPGCILITAMEEGGWGSMKETHEAPQSTRRPQVRWLPRSTYRPEHGQQNNKKKNHCGDRLREQSSKTAHVDFSRFSRIKKKKKNECFVRKAFGPTGDYGEQRFRALASVGWNSLFWLLVLLTLSFF